jgi:hypothetical protein
VFSQSFEHTEVISGLGMLEENNGVAVADYDGDLDLDIFIVAKQKIQKGILNPTADFLEIIMMGLLQTSL